MKTHVVFVIRRLDRGGAERQLLELASGLDKQRFRVTILTFYDGGALLEAINPITDVQVVNLGRTGSWDIARFLFRLIRTIRRLQPDIVHGYMSGANELTVVAGRACGAKVVWGVRSSDRHSAPVSRGMRWLVAIGARMSRFTDRIIVNSQHGRTFHVAQGYCEERFTVIHNGVNTDVFRTSPAERHRVRREWAVADDDVLIGRAARFDPCKDYPLFLRAAGKVARIEPRARFVCIGDGTDREELRRIVEAEGIGDRVIWAGGRADMPAVYNALDVCVSSSVSEGFPNTIVESMACGVPCVVTDVGDSAAIVGDVGLVVPSGSADRLAQAILDLLARQQHFSRDRVRRRVVEHFGLDRLVARTAEEFERLLA